MDTSVRPTPSSQSEGPLTLRKNFSWTALGNVIYAACQWGIVTVLAKVGTPLMVGQFALALAISAPIIQFSNLQLRAVQATDAQKEYRFVDYFSLRIVTTILAMLASIGVASWSGDDRETIIVIALVALAKAVDAFSDIFYGLFQQREQMDIIAKALVGNGVLSLTLLGAGVLLTDSLIVGVSAYAIGSIIPFFVYVVPKARRITGIEFRFSDPAKMKRLVFTSLPLGIAMLLISMNTNVPRYFVESYLGTENLGVFAALAYLIVSGSTIVSALGQAVSPRLSQYYATGRIDLYRRMLLQLMLFGVGLGLLGSVLAKILGEQIVSILYTKEYAAHTDVLVLLSLSASLAFAASFAGYGMTAARYFAVQAPIFALVLAVTLLTSALLIPTMGLRGAAIVPICSASIQLISVIIVLAYAVRSKTMDDKTSAAT